MTKPKLRHPQVHIEPEVIEQRVDLCRWYLTLTRTMFELAFPPDCGGFGSNMELMLVLMGVFVGDAEGRPPTATKIAGHCGLSRPTVYRRLEQLMKLRKVERSGHNYFVAPGVSPSDPMGLLPRVLEKFPLNVRPKRTH